MNQPNSEERDRLVKLVETHINQLREHVDSVQIFVSNAEEGGDSTFHYASGGGNWFARFGQVVEWLEIYKGHSRAAGVDKYHEEDNE